MRKNILLVEYAVSTIDTIKELLSHPIFEITVVDEGDLAKDLLAKETYDMVITAAMLPKFHGFNLSHHASSTYPGIKVIIISEIYKGMDYKHQAITQYKADDFFEKPLEKDIFKQRVLELLDVNENDLTDTGTLPTNEIPMPDTKKIPTLQKLEEEERKLTSEDLFGDIIEQVQESPAFEIKLDEEMEKETGPHVIKPPKKPEKPEDIAVTREMPALTQIRPQAKTTTAPDAPDAPDAPTVPTGPGAPKRPPHPAAGTATQKIDLDIDALMKPKKEKTAATDSRDKEKFKKIEDDISKRFEETLSGLGIKSRKTHLKDTRPIQTYSPPEQTPLEPVEPVEEKQTTELIEPMTAVTVVEAPEPPIPEAPPASEAPETGEKRDEVGDYEILGLIARGGMAEIYKAKKRGVKGFEKIIALKKILSGYGKDDKYIEMFVDEAKIAAELSHPNIVQIHDLGKKDDYYFIAMEYVSGTDLRLILRKLAEADRYLPEELSLYMVLEVLKALNYAHTAKNSAGKNLDIVHRDISPPNIMVSYSGDVKLTDFGVSKASIKMHHTVAGALKGKLLYMSPEQARADKDIDHRSDLYSAGIILFELITSEKLFMGPSEMAVLQSVQAGEIQRPSQVKKDIDPQLEIILLKMLNKDKTKRYQKATDIISDLQAYLAKNYSRLPSPVHLSHAICNLFQEEIYRDGIKIDLKPIPYKIKKIKKELPKPRTEPDIPVVSVEPPPAKPTEPTEPTEPAEPPKFTEPEPPVPAEEENAIFDLEEEEIVAEEEEFHPLVEIDFNDKPDEEPVKEVPLIEEPQIAAAPVPPAPPVPGEKAAGTASTVSSFSSIEEDEFKKKKKYLLIALAVIIILGAVIVVYLITIGGSADVADVNRESMPPVKTQKPAAVTTPGAGDETGPGTTDPASPTPSVKTEVSYQPEEKPKTQGKPAVTTTTTPKPPEIKKETQTQVPVDAKEQKPVPPKVKEAEKPAPPEDQIKLQQAAQELQKQKEAEDLRKAQALEEEKRKREEERKKLEAEQARVNEGDILPITEVDTPPAVLSQPPINIAARYTRTLKSSEAMLVSYLVDHNGNVEDLRLIRKSSVKKINALITKAIRSWKFKPAVKNNVKVKVWKTISLSIKK
ncbi:MAG: protein kinase [bacterium]|nr:protein kinase [bacterium]